MQRDWKLIGIFPIDLTVQIMLPDGTAADVVEACRQRLAEWFNHGSVAYPVTATWTDEDGSEETREMLVVETHAGNAQLDAHGDALHAFVEDLRTRLGLDIAVRIGPLAPPVPPAPQVFSIQEAADYLGLSVASVKHHIYKVGDLHPDKTDPAVIFTRFELDRFKATPRPGPGPRKRG